MVLLQRFGLILELEWEPLSDFVLITVGNIHVHWRVFIPKLFCIIAVRREHDFGKDISARPLFKVQRCHFRLLSQWVFRQSLLQRCLHFIVHFATVEIWKLTIRAFFTIGRMITLWVCYNYSTWCLRRWQYIGDNLFTPGCLILLKLRVGHQRCIDTHLLLIWQVQTPEL